MSKLKQLRRKWGYETDVPRCETCVQFVPARYYLRDSLPRPVPPMCKAAGFQVGANSVCDRWTGKAGDVLLSMPSVALDRETAR